MENTQPSMPDAGQNNGKKIMTIVGALVVVGIIGEIAIQSSKSSTTAPTPSTTPISTSYKDGTYTAVGDYTTHAGPEAVQITVTLKDNIITDTQFQATPNERLSQRYQGMFADNYKALVIGKNINDVQLGAVSGSSLTPMGFNDAIAKIQQQAKI